ncbi:hypothetical protein BASA50_001019 [Batrachochytrium salamandrivorans]|uniref:Ubiquitin-like protease family profile domain-containing protein n=1 Tax=Batrachochytrium salamandrivorans TaxID=1357716 RepID=A0ABQ8EUP9_9FUNG|nr:hypothetical protein BASA50_001019 [Batrachochytrium salamandrivorans]KAH9248979.1 hypothetical protein BASA81_013323 [Batrachochytrium salamandrivorans]
MVQPQQESNGAAAGEDNELLVLETSALNKRSVTSVVTSLYEGLLTPLKYFSAKRFKEPPVVADTSSASNQPENTAALSANSSEHLLISELARGAAHHRPDALLLHSSIPAEQSSTLQLPNHIIDDNSFLEATPSRKIDYQPQSHIVSALEVMRPPKHSDLHPNLVNGFRDTTTSNTSPSQTKSISQIWTHHSVPKNITSSNLRVFPNTDPRLKNRPIITTGRAKTPQSEGLESLRTWNVSSTLTSPSLLSTVSSSRSLFHRLGAGVSKKRAYSGLTYNKKNKIRQGKIASIALIREHIPEYIGPTRSGLKNSQKNLAGFESYVEDVELSEHIQKSEASRILARKLAEKKTSTKPSTTSGHRSDISKSKIAPFTINAVGPSHALSDTQWIVDLKQSVLESEKSRLSLDDIRALGINTPLYDSILERDSKNLQQIKVLHQQKEEERAIIPLSQEAQKKVEDAMSSGAGILVKEFSVSISKKDMHTLSGSSWLNDEIINFYGQLCMKRANEAPDLYPKIHVFNTFFYEKLRTQGYSSIRRWTKKVDLFSKDLVIIPIHIGMHWTCAAINFKNSQFEYYDSLLGDNFSCLELLRDYLIQEHADKKKEPIDLDDWSDYIPKDIPTQQNGYDCGVFTCTFMEFLARQAEFSFSQDDMGLLRRRIAYEILTTTLLSN